VHSNTLYKMVLHFRFEAAPKTGCADGMDAFPRKRAVQVAFVPMCESDHACQRFLKENSK
jgi:hypothetical protein